MPKQKFFIFIFIILFYFLSVPLAYALEMPYPSLPGVGGLPENPTLPQYVSYFFALGTSLAGILAIISFAIGAVQMIMAAGSPEMANSGKDRMKGSALGLLLTASAYIILTTINLQLATPTITALPAGAGIFYQGTELSPAPIEEANPANFRGNLLYKCSEQGGGSGPNLFVWKFPKSNFQGNNANYSGVTMAEISCGNSTSLSGVGSFRTAFKTEGVYYYLENGCSGYMSGANMASSALSEPFKDKIKSIKIVNNPLNDIRYGAIFHEPDDPTRGGYCSSPLMTEENTTEKCIDIDTYVEPSSVTIFLWNAQKPDSSGDGIEFYSEPFGWQSGQRAGKCFLSQKSNQDNPTLCNDLGTIGNLWFNTSDYLEFDYTNVDRPPEYRQSYLNFKIRPGSIRINGNYLVVLYNQHIYCQAFYRDVPNLNEMELVTVYNKIDQVYIIPTK